MPPDASKSLFGLSLQELTEIAAGRGEPAYRVRQIFDALYRQRVTSLDAITTLPQAMRRDLAQSGYAIGLPEVEHRYASADGTVRYLFRFADGQSVETVWMPEGDGGEAGDGTEAGEEEDRKSVV